MAQAMEGPQPPPAIRIFVDADACPVKPEIYRVAERYGFRSMWWPMPSWRCRAAT